MNWFSAFSPLEQVFWACAIISSVIFIIQMVLTLIGMDSSDVDVDFDVADFGSVDSDTMDLGGGISLFSIRNLINFLLGFGWGGVSFSNAIESPFLLILVSIVIGILFVLMFFYVKKQTKRFEANGAFNIHLCEGKTANVYLRIPEGGTGKGKVQVSVNGAAHEIDAITDGAAIKTGALVRITTVIDGQTLKVEPLSEHS